MPSEHQAELTAIEMRAFACLMDDLIYRAYAVTDREVRRRAMLKLLME
ncbi:hypothetical protein NT239_05795 [Chitinibacter sp. SCUT-21]